MLSEGVESSALYAIQQNTKQLLCFQTLYTAKQHMECCMSLNIAGPQGNTQFEMKTENKQNKKGGTNTREFTCLFCSCLSPKHFSQTHTENLPSSGNVPSIFFSSPKKQQWFLLLLLFCFFVFLFLLFIRLQTQRHGNFSQSNIINSVSHNGLSLMTAILSGVCVGDWNSNSTVDKIRYAPREPCRAENNSARQATSDISPSRYRKPPFYRPARVLWNRCLHTALKSKEDRA